MLDPRPRALALLVAALALVSADAASAPPQKPGSAKAGAKGGPPKKGEKGGKKRRRAGSVGGREKDHHTPSLGILSTKITCPDGMVAVAGRFCIDRFEATLVEPETHEPLSPYYPPSPGLLKWSVEHWTKEREGEAEGSLARDMPLPVVPDFQAVGKAFKMKAMSWPSSVPSGYATGEHAEAACKNAGKRLCSEAEWVTACRGEKQTTFPYGDKYREGQCNVFREDHPAHILHGSFSVGLSDPRLNQIDLEGAPLLRTTGKTESCKSVWGDDAVYDMVGNLDEWVADAEGTFVGGFYARATRNGCDSRVTAHPISYFDYSTGVRCCADP